MYIHCMYSGGTPLLLGTQLTVLISRVSLVQPYFCTELPQLGLKKVYIFEGCSYSGGVRIEGFHMPHVCVSLLLPFVL